MDKGKNFSRNRPRADRMEADFYQTPSCLTETFINEHMKRFWSQKLPICDYCCGEGAMSDILEQDGYDVIKADISRGQDFFQQKEKKPYGVMNPPFRLFNKWVEHCFKVFTVSFALLAPTTYLQGVSRYNSRCDGIYQKKDYPLAHIYTFNRYPLLTARLRPDDLIETGMQALSWYVWDNGDPPLGTETTHHWIDIDKYVFRKSRMKK
ncbi:hypothetical protein FACS189447_03060 [Spirochaetia bacterium]|nr:hypothetical protein FACS189447_03060 [Spirochaetia bacterium]